MIEYEPCRCFYLYWSGRLKNPNRYTIGLEVASGYDVDRDGVLETWEKAYTPTQIKATAWFILNHIEKDINTVFGNHNILIHKDIDSGKPDLELHRAMVVAELESQRNPDIDPIEPPPIDPCLLKNGDKVVGVVEKNKIVIAKVD